MPEMLGVTMIEDREKNREMSRFDDTRCSLEDP